MDRLATYSLRSFWAYTIDLRNYQVCLPLLSYTCFLILYIHSIVWRRYKCCWFVTILLQSSFGLRQANQSVTFCLLHPSLSITKIPHVFHPIHVPVSLHWSGGQVNSPSTNHLFAQISLPSLLNFPNFQSRQHTISQQHHLSNLLSRSFSRLKIDFLTKTAPWFSSPYSNSIDLNSANRHSHSFTSQASPSCPPPTLLLLLLLTMSNFDTRDSATAPLAILMMMSVRWSRLAVLPAVTAVPPCKFRRRAPLPVSPPPLIAVVALGVAMLMRSWRLWTENWTSCWCSRRRIVRSR